jgi:hypothetical protein
MPRERTFLVKAYKKQYEVGEGESKVKLREREKNH